MGRLFLLLALCALLACAAPRAQEPAQSVFFSLLFPQLMPDRAETATPDEAFFAEAVLL